MSLPGALKHILTLRSPSALASPGLSKLAPILGKTLREAEAHKAENGWLAVATATFLTANSPEAVADLYTFVTRKNLPADVSSSSTNNATNLHSVDDRTAKAALMREAGLKCAVFVGVPKVINSLSGLTARLDEDVKAKLNREPLRIHYNERVGIEQVAARGKKLFASVYDPHTEKLLAKLGSYHPDFPGFIIGNEYGALLSDPPPGSYVSDGRVGRTLTSAAGVACLRASGGLGPQLISHVYGLLKAKGYDNSGRAPATADSPEGDDWLASAEGATWVIEVVDCLVDVVHGKSEGP